MKKDIHPEYKEALVTCGCGNSFKTRSTREKIAIEVCSNCHPFYTGKQKFVDTAGMVEKFQRKWQSEAAQKAKAAAAKPVPKKAVVLVRSQALRVQQTIAAQLGTPKQTAPAPRPKPAAPAIPPPPLAPSEGSKGARVEGPPQNA